MKRLSIGLVEGRVLDHASHVHLCSSDELSQVSRVRELGQRSRVFPLGVDLTGEESSRQKNDIAGRLRQIAGRPIVLFMSRIHEIKGLDRLLTAFATVRHTRPDTLLVIAGTGDKRLVASLQAQARRLGIEDRTHWLGFVQGQQKQQLLSLATVFVLPAYSENFGYAVLEAMQAGLVVVTTQSVPAGAFVTEANAGIIYDGSVAQLEQSIIEVLDLPETERREIGQRASTEVHDRLSMQTFGDSLESLYREAARSR